MPGCPKAPGMAKAPEGMMNLLQASGEASGGGLDWKGLMGMPQAGGATSPVDRPRRRGRCRRTAPRSRRRRRRRLATSSSC